MFGFRVWILAVNQAFSFSASFSLFLLLDEEGKELDGPSRPLLPRTARRFFDHIDEIAYLRLKEKSKTIP